MTWYQLWKRIGKQTIKQTMGNKVELLMDGHRYELCVVYTHSGSEFHLEIKKEVSE